MTEINPIFLLADSQLLFWKDKDKHFLDRILECLKDKNVDGIKAAYIGASNEDNPVYFDIFKEAMRQIGITNCRMIPSIPDVSDIDFLNLADLVLLAGGDVKLGLEVFKKNGFDKIILDKYHKGGVIIGVSAGAVQLGALCYDSNNEDENSINTLKIIPYSIDVQNKKDDWALLNEALKNGDSNAKGFGIPSGGGMIFHSNWSIEAVRHSLSEFVKNEEAEISHSIIIPPLENENSENEIKAIDS